MSDILPVAGPTRPPAAELAIDRNDPLFRAARELEGAFLSEMLKSAGLGKARDAFGGGVGEDQFSSLLRDMQAREMAEAGGIGLAEALYRSMTQSSDGR